ncbi:MAG: hypothetical protein PSY12_08740 [bacterium]|nr:hypothetical protein [bacterium]
MTDSLSTLTALRHRIAALNHRREVEDVGLLVTGHAALDAALGGGLAKGRLHELFSAQAEDAGSAAGFALLIGLLAGADETQPLLWLRTEGAERVGGRLYGPGLAAFGLDPARLLLGVMQDEAMLLRAAADALRCPGLAAVVVECWGNPRILDLTASRRLTLAAEGSGVTALLLRLDAQPSPSAAETRWQVAAAPSGAATGASGDRLLGRSAFYIELLRRRAGPDGLRWRLEWNRERRHFEDPGQQAALSGALVSLPAAGPAADRAA